jgi:hypothetical protein
MKMTLKLLNAAKSTTGGYSKKQFELLGVTLYPPMMPASGWRKGVVGKEYPDEVVHELLELKDAHLTPTIIINQTNYKLKKAQRRADIRAMQGQLVKRT